MKTKCFGLKKIVTLLAFGTAGFMLIAVPEQAITLVVAVLASLLNKLVSKCLDE